MKLVFKNVLETLDKICYKTINYFRKEKEINTTK